MRMREEMTAVWTRTRCLVFVFPLSLFLLLCCWRDEQTSLH